MSKKAVDSAKIKKISVKTDDKSKRKQLLAKICIIVGIVIAITAAVYFILWAIAPDEPERKKIKQIEESYPTFNPFDNNTKESVSLDEEYKHLYKEVSYGIGEEGGNLLPFAYVVENEGHRFFEEYFNILKNGDHKEYAKLFDEKLYIEDDSFEKDIDGSFNPQMVYDITVRDLYGIHTPNDDGEIIGVYLVDYKIHKNDNSFREDIGFNGSQDTHRPLYFELITYDAGTAKEKTYITNIYTYSSIKHFLENGGSK